MHLITLLSIVFVLNTGCQKNDNSLDFKIEANSATVSQNSELLISLKFRNIGSSEELIPKEPIYSYEKGIMPDQKADIIFDLQKLSGSEYMKQHVEALIQSVPIDSSLARYAILKQNDTTFFKFPLDAFYKFSKGKYKVRAMYNSPNKKAIYSNWLEFEVVKDLPLM